jgi:hypothetical protein
MREQQIHFEELDRIGAVESIVEKLTDVMQRMDPQEPAVFAKIARQWTFDFINGREGATIELAAEIARSVEQRVLGVLQARSSAN